MDQFFRTLSDLFLAQSVERIGPSVERIVRPFCCPIGAKLLPLVVNIETSKQANKQTNKQTNTLLPIVGKDKAVAGKTELVVSQDVVVVATV